MRAWIGTVTPMTPEREDRLRMIEEWRAGGGMSSAHFWLDNAGHVLGMNEEDDMAKTLLHAEGNPYRRDLLGVGQELRYEMMTPESRGSGPGLLGADIDRIAREHHGAGERAGKQAMRAEVERAEGRLAEVFDEGYTAGRAERATGLANDFRVRIAGVHFAVQAVENGPKTKRDERLAVARTELDELMAFAEAMRLSPERAAAQVARDEE